MPIGSARSVGARDAACASRDAVSRRLLPPAFLTLWRDTNLSAFLLALPAKQEKAVPGKRARPRRRPAEMRAVHEWRLFRHRRRVPAYSEGNHYQVG